MPDAQWLNSWVPRERESYNPDIQKGNSTYEIKSDNGPPFNSQKFEENTQEEDFKHRKVTLGWAEANGDVERFMQRIKITALIAALEEG